MKPDNYTCIEFNGLLLNPTFSIYMLEISKQESDEKLSKHYYIGMTGDVHYPSARSIMHRLAGHIDLLKTSTQNQLIKGIKKLFNKHKKNEYLSSDELKKLNIKLHHWAIEGFTPWKKGMRNINKKGRLYKAYSDVQKKVAALEKKIILDFKAILINNTKGKDSVIEKEYQYIYDDIKKLIDSGRNSKKDRVQPTLTSTNKKE